MPDSNCWVQRKSTTNNLGVLELLLFLLCLFEITHDILGVAVQYRPGIWGTFYTSHSKSCKEHDACMEGGLY